MNAPSITVVSGPTEAIARFCGGAVERQVGVARSASGDVARVPSAHGWTRRAGVRARARRTSRSRRPASRVILNATGRLPGPRRRPPIRATGPTTSGIRCALTACTRCAPGPAFVELGPGDRACDLFAGTSRRARSSGCCRLRRRPTTSAWARARRCRLWCAGADVDWACAEAGERRSIVALPTYPFERSRHWRDDEHARLPGWRETLYERGFREAPLDHAHAARHATRPWIVMGGGTARRRAARADRRQMGGARRRRWSPASEVRWIGEGATASGPDSRKTSRPRRWRRRRGNRRARRALHVGSVTGPPGRTTAPRRSRRRPRADSGRWSRSRRRPTTAAPSDGPDVVVVADALARLDGEPGAPRWRRLPCWGPPRHPAGDPAARDARGRRSRLDGADVPAWFSDALIREAVVAGAPALVALRPGARFEQLYALPALPGVARLRDGGVVDHRRHRRIGSRSRACSTTCAGRGSRWTRAGRRPRGGVARAREACATTGSAARSAAVLEFRSRGAEVAILEAGRLRLRPGSPGRSRRRGARYGGLHGVIHAAGALADAGPREDAAECRGVSGPGSHGGVPPGRALAGRAARPPTCRSRRRRRSSGPGPGRLRRRQRGARRPSRRIAPARHGGLGARSAGAPGRRSASR